MLNTADSNLLTNIRTQIAPMSDSFEKNMMEYLIRLIDRENNEENSRPTHLKSICVRLLSILNLFHQRHQSKTLDLEAGLNFTKSMAKSFGIFGLERGLFYINEWFEQDNPAMSAAVTQTREALKEFHKTLGQSALNSQHYRAAVGLKGLVEDYLNYLVDINYGNSEDQIYLIAALHLLRTEMREHTAKLREFSAMSLVSWVRGVEVPTESAPSTPDFLLQSIGHTRLQKLPVIRISYYPRDYFDAFQRETEYPLEYVVDIAGRSAIAINQADFQAVIFQRFAPTEGDTKWVVKVFAPNPVTHLLNACPQSILDEFSNRANNIIDARDEDKKDNFRRCSPAVKFSIYSVLLLQVFRQHNSDVYELSWIIDIARMAAGLTEAINPYSLCQLPLLQWMQDEPKNSEAGQLYRQMLTTLGSNLEDDERSLSTSESHTL